MSAGNPLAAEILEASAAGFAAAANALMEREMPEGAGRDAGAWQAHIKQRILELAAAVRLGDPALFTHRISWLRRAAKARGNEDTSILLALRSLRGALSEELPDHLRSRVVPFIEQALTEPENGESGLQPSLELDSRNGRIAQDYLSACLEGNPNKASQSILTAIDGGFLTPTEAYTDVIVPAQKEVGRLWHVGEITVAEERLVTETTRRLMSQIAMRFAPTGPDGPTMLAASVAGNAHDIGLRVVSDLFILAGWRCLFLGANVPTADIASAARNYEAKLTVLTATLGTQLNTLNATIEAIRQHAPDTKVLVGGSAFGDSPSLWEQVGADAFASSVDEAVAAGTRLLGD